MTEPETLPAATDEAALWTADRAAELLDAMLRLESARPRNGSAAGLRFESIRKVRNAADDLRHIRQAAGDRRCTKTARAAFDAKWRSYDAFGLKCPDITWTH